MKSKLLQLSVNHLLVFILKKTVLKKLFFILNTNLHWNDGFLLYVCAHIVLKESVISDCNLTNGRRLPNRVWIWGVVLDFWANFQIYPVT